MASDPFSLFALGTFIGEWRAGGQRSQQGGCVPVEFLELDPDGAGPSRARRVPMAFRASALDSARTECAPYRGGARGGFVPIECLGRGPDGAGPSQAVAMQGCLSKFLGGPRSVAAVCMARARHVSGTFLGLGPDEAGPSRRAAILWLKIL